MSLVRWQPRSAMAAWDPFRDVNEMRSMMSRFFGWPYGHSEEGPMEADWVPRVDIVQEKERYLVQADLPGMKREEIDITVNGDTLTITGERKSERKTQEDNFYRSERHYGRFSRSLILPSSVDADRIEAAYKDGVLQLAIPKSEQAGPKQIKIES